MKREFKKYHEDLADAVFKFFWSNKLKANVYLSTGLGKINAL